MTIEAGIGFEAARNWWGRSFCVWELLEVEGAIGCVAYQRDLSLAAVLDAEHERLLQSACRVGQGEESLVRSLRGLSINGGEESLGESVFNLTHGMCISSLVLRGSADTSAFAGNRNGGILKAPGRS